MKKYLVFLIFCSLSCTTDSNKVINSSIISINPDEAIEGKFSDIFEDIDYIFLSDADDFPVIRPGKITMGDSGISLVDWDLDKFVSYNLSGQPSFQLTPLGNGPGQFVRAEDFQINQEGIIIKDPVTGKFLFYDWKGNFLKEQKSSVKISDFYYTDDFIVHYGKNAFELGPYQFYVDKSGRIEKILAMRTPKVRAILASKDGFVWDSNSRKLLYRIPNSSQVAFFSSEGELVDLVKVDFGSAGILEDEKNQLTIDQTIELQMDEKVVLEISSFYPIKSGYYLSYARGLKESMEVLLDKDFKVVKHLKNLKNDIDQMPMDVVPWFATEDIIGFYMHASDFRNDYRKMFSDDQLPAKDSNLYRFVSEFGPRLGEDTFILVLCKLKTLD